MCKIDSILYFGRTGVIALTLLALIIVFLTFVLLWCLLFLIFFIFSRLSHDFPLLHLVSLSFIFLLCVLISTCSGVLHLSLSLFLFSFSLALLSMFISSLYKVHTAGSLISACINQNGRNKTQIGPNQNPAKPNSDPNKTQPKPSHEQHLYVEPLGSRGC